MTIHTDKVKEEFSKRLHTAMDAAGYPARGRARVLSQKFSISDKGAGKWLNADAIPETSKIPLLASFLKINAEWLISGAGDMFPNEAPNHKNLDTNVSEPIPLIGKLVPVISWVQAGSWTTVEAVPAGTEFEEWLPPNPKCGKHGYGLEVSGESMLPDFRPSDKIYVNPDFQVSDLKTGDLVIVSCEGDKAATFKKLIVETDNMYLQPLNPEWSEKAIALEDGCKLVGKVVGLYRDV
ncbi:S24 family peptidase [Acinetobacter johnsonii]|uniref:LexA family protein n=1 Tax=Acinetobacter johnsonii TaxID=40214 RepID=UPI002D7FCFAF|nr:S24 family peptidase [Acinetobacter johnsonii]